ncbi:hypothetical protein [Confluentibacter flavum]|uniref:Fibronectin type-III domain-containing protein n=1 Tax=Confluentibacter flavum TaxID=1909700 RepID=A0A2N3HL31_9FLAO|nr:hypothetical protein [Confluentibacter flavum]PKQ45667.1 hypothetical protein CSW08_06255 [Confluentibacter flavum]
MKPTHRKFNKILSIITLSIILSNCAYDFSEDSFFEVTQKTPTASISLNSLSDNQIFYVTTRVNFSYNGNNKHRLYEIKIYIDNIEIKTTTTNSGDFIIDTESLEDGNHILKIEYIFSSGSGSLADVSGVEAYIKTEEYNFIVDKSPPPTIVMKSVEIIDGSIYLKWEPITETNFDKALLIITNNGNSNYLEITKQELLNLTYNDTYVHTSTSCTGGQSGNYLEYEIYLENTRGNTISNKVSLSIKPFEIQKLILNENEYKLIIPKHALYNNFDYYSFNDDYNNSVHKVSSQGGEIIVDEPIKFPNLNIGVTFSLYQESGSEDIYKGCLFTFESYFEQFDSGAGGSYNEYIYNEDNDVIYALKIDSSCGSCLDNITIYKLDPIDLEIIDSKVIAIVEAYDNQELTIDPITHNLILDAGSISLLVDKNNFSIINQWEISGFGEQSGNIFYRDNIIVIEQVDNIIFYDSSTKAQFYAVSKTGYFNISDNGRYFYANDTIFEINNKIVIPLTITNTNNSVNLVKFMEGLNKCIYNTYDGNPVIFDFASQTKTVLSDFTRINIMDYDVYTKKLLLVRSEYGFGNSTPSYAYVYGLMTNEFKRIEVGNIVSAWNPEEIPRGYWFANNKLIYRYVDRNGYYLDHYINE